MVEEQKAHHMIPLMRNAFSHETETREALADFVLTTHQFSMGEQCLRFERQFASKQGRREAVLFNSGGGANFCLLQALKNLGRLCSGDSIGFSSLTWSTNVSPILALGLAPVPVDINPSTLNSMSADLDRCRLSKGLRAFFLTNALGFSGDLDRIRAMCADRGILLLEDNCESLGAELLTGKTGNFGLASTFSSFVGHHMSTCEGGMCRNR